MGTLSIYSSQICFKAGEIDPDDVLAKLLKLYEIHAMQVKIRGYDTDEDTHE